MTLRLPTPPASYDQRTQAEVHRQLEALMRAVFGEQATTLDPRRMLHNFRVKSETDEEITFAWERGELVADIWLNHRLVTAPITGDPWGTIDPLAPEQKLGAADEVTLAKPAADEKRIAQWVPRTSDLAPGPTIRREIDPAANHMSGSIKAAVTNNTADLTVTVTGAKADYPARVRVYEDEPDGTPIVDATTTGDVTWTKAVKAALGGRALPLRELRRWWLRLTNKAGVDAWLGPTSADRDALPSGSVTASGSTLRCEYDDDTDTITIAAPNGATKVFTGLSGGGTVSYAVGGAVTTGSVETALAAEEVRDGYVVTYTGGGENVVMFRGSLVGPAAALAVRAWATVTGGTANLNVSLNGAAAHFVTPGLTVKVYEGNPTSAAIYTKTGVTAATTLTGAGTTGSLSARALPLKSMQQWWVEVTDQAGRVVVYGPWSADRDALPEGAVSPIGSILRVDYDDDTDYVKITLPNGATKQWGPLAGRSYVQYTVGDAVTTGSPEAALLMDETRATYQVELRGAGSDVWVTVWRGALFGPKATYVDAKLTVSVAGDLATVAVTAEGSSVVFPIVASIYEGTPTGTAIATTTLLYAGTHTLTAANRPLTGTETQHWWAKLEDSAGITRWLGPASADRDPLPGVAVFTDEATTTLPPRIIMLPDDDTQQLRVTTPSGTKTYGSLTGAAVTYSVGDTLGGGGAESAIAPDGSRAGYKVEATADGVTWVTVADALVLYGKAKDFSGPNLTVTVTPGSTTTFNWTLSSWGGLGTGTLYKVIDGVTTTITTSTGSGSFSVTKTSADQQVQILARNDVTQESSRSFTVPATVTTPTTYGFSSFSVFPVNYTTDQVPLNWSGTFPFGATFRIWVFNSQRNYWADEATTSSTSYTYTTAEDIKPGATYSYKFYIECESGDGVVARSATKSFSWML